MEEAKPAVKPRRRGRYKKEEKLAIELSKHSISSLEQSLAQIRLKMQQRLAEDSNDPSLNRERSDDVKSLYALWKSGKEILDDLKREEAAKNQTGAGLRRLLDEANDALAELSWLDD